jgi:ribosomal protein S27AE
MGDGYLNKCIACVKNRVTKHRNENLEKIREYDKSRAMLPHRVQARKEYSNTEKGKIAKTRALKNYHERYPLKRASHVITGNAIRDGKLVRPSSCFECASTEKIEAHHDDYTKPLDVRWLCRKCHYKWHKHNTPIFQ